MDVAKALTPAPDAWFLPRSPSREDGIAVFSAAEAFGFEGGSVITITLHFASELKKHSFARLKIRLSAQHGKDRKAGRFVFDPASKDLKSDFVRTHHKDFKQRLRQARDAFKAEKNRTVPVMVMQEQAKKRETRILLRGSYDAPGDPVTPAVPALLGGWKKDYPNNRMGLARWLTSTDNPLMARVTVNRYWQMLFGVGLVKTTEDFGVQGEAPSHPELLDHLSRAFADGGWDLRGLIKNIVLSATYRQSSIQREDVDDPENRWLARGPRFRLSAEAIRDQALFVSGLLERAVGGPSVMTYQPEGLWLDLGDRRGFSRKHVVGNHQQIHRRSMYVYAKRAMPNPTLSTFDTPSRDVCVVKRENTNTPLQALVLRHEIGYVESARVLRRASDVAGEELRAPVGPPPGSCCSRDCQRPRNRKTMKTFHADRLVYFRDHPEVRDKLLTLGKQSAPR